MTQEFCACTHACSSCHVEACKHVKLFDVLPVTETKQDCDFVHVIDANISSDRQMHDCNMIKMMESELRMVKTMVCVVQGVKKRRSALCLIRTDLSQEA